MQVLFVVSTKSALDARTPLHFARSSASDLKVKKIKHLDEKHYSLALYSVVRKVQGQTAKHTKYATF